MSDGEQFTILAPYAMEICAVPTPLNHALFMGSHFVESMLAVPVGYKQAAATRPRDATQAAVCSSTAEGCSEAIKAGSNKRKADAEALEYPERPQKRAECESAASESQPASLSTLPTEIHHHIFQYLEEIEDVVNLGLVNQHFFTLAPEYVHSRVAGRFGLWANQSIICVGEYLYPGDYPPTLSQASLEESLAEMEGFDELELSAEQEEPGAPTLSLAHLAQISNVVRPLCTTDETRRIGEKLCLQPGVTRAMLEELGLPLCTEDWDRYFPPDQPWILRILDAKHFVRAEAIALKPEWIHGPIIRIIGFGAAVLSHICWSPFHDGLRVVGFPDWSQGPWAGRRFDITTLARHQEETGDGADWFDASDEVVEWLDKILEIEVGDDWRELHLTVQRPFERFHDAYQ